MPILPFGFKVINNFRSDKPKGFYDPIKLHSGIDVGCPIGTPLSLPIKTKFVKLLKQDEMGNTLYLEDEAGNVLVFAHLSDYIIGKSEFAPNEVFAHSGNTGAKTTGAHLHFEIVAKKPDAGLEMMTRVLGATKGYNIDPMRYLNEIYAPKPVEKPIGDVEWCVQHGIMREMQDITELMSFEDFATCARQLAGKVLEWSRNQK